MRGSAGLKEILMAKMESYWRCSNCDAQVDYNLEVCWRCQHNQYGVIPEGLSTSEEDRLETPIPTDKVPNRICLRCKTDMTFAGRKDFHEGTRWGMFGDLGELLVNQTKLEMYFCPACRHVEFFV